MSHVIAITNQKGGVGKTTTSINLASYMAKAGKKVLIVDLDPQGNASSGLGLSKNEFNKTTSQLLMGEIEIEKATVEIAKNLSIIPATSELAGTEVELVSMDNRERKLKDVLANQKNADIVIIDCPPSLSLLTVNGLVASDFVIIPVQAEYYALEGLSQLLDTLRRVRVALNPNLKLLGVVVTMFDNRTSLSSQVYDQLKTHFKEKVFKTVIPRNVRLAEAPSHGKPISEHDKWSKGARSYKHLSKEVINRVSQ